MAATDPKPLLPAETIRLAFQLMLGRDVENEEVIKNLQTLGTVAALRNAIVGSAEYKSKSTPLLPGSLAVLAHAPRKVDIHVTPEQFELLFERLRAQWTKLGETEPHWSVLTSPMYKTANFAEHEAEFYKSGEVTAAGIERAFQRVGLEINHAGTVLELGCGTGRVTHALAGMFAHVVGADVSPGNLHLCEEKIRQLNKTNVECRLLKSPGDIESIPPIDFFFSTIVLQHNPPPIIHYFLSKILAKLRKGGAVLFQVPTSTPGYSFDVERYLGSAVHTMDMHCLPQPAVFALFAKYKLTPMEVLMDGMTGQLGSNTFLAVRK